MNLVETLEEQQRAWNERPLLRRLYRGWFRLIRDRLATVPGPTVELGAGIGRFKEAVPEAVATDVEATPWADAVVDADALPYDDGTLANLVLIDVFHHLARPTQLLDEARRALALGGRLVILDPYCSPVSTPAYQRLHHERTDLSVPSLADDSTVALSPLDSNQARATLVFFRDRERFEERWPELSIVERRRLALFLYPLSGGFSRRPLIPAGLHSPLALLERALEPLLGWLLAFRCLIVLERRAGT